MKVLLLGFGPFPEIKNNHTSSIVKYIETHQGNIGLQIRSGILQVSFDKCRAQIEKQIIDYKPDAVILVGIKFSSATINLEKVALNVINSQSPDSEGTIIKDKLIIPGGREAYFSAFDLNLLRDRLTNAGIQSIVSYHAGTYICNQAYYLACNLLHKLNLNTNPRALLIHVPLLPSQLPPGYENYGIVYSTSRKAVRLCLEVLRDELINKNLS